MFAQVTAINVKDVFFRHSVPPLLPPPTFYGSYIGKPSPVNN